MTQLPPVDITVPRDPISDRASEFLERKRFGEWSEIDQAELNIWLAESALHRVAYLRVEAAVARTKQLVSIYPEEFGGNLVRLYKKAFRWGIPVLAAASVILAAEFGFPLVASLLQPPDHVYSTEIGGRSLLNFADRTQIELNTDSIVRFRMTNKERAVWLEKGEAWFHVAHNAHNPFTVYVGRRRITDLGTEFLVNSAPGRLEVAVVSGRAALSADGTPATVLTPGDEAVATSSSVSLTRKTPQELADELAWRRGVLVFRNTRLADVVREFNRYNTTKLVIADPSIANVKIYAEIRTDRYEDLLSLVHQVLNLRADREGDEIFISRERDETPKKASHVKRGI